MAYVKQAYLPRPVEILDADDDYDSPLPLTGTTVYEQESRFTGILDAEGNRIHFSTDPIGFRFSENDR